eukprot:12901435-Prorocentrum_lima.AAC.1
MAKSHNMFKLRVLQTAQQLAEAFLDILKGGYGKLFAAFSNAGPRLKRTDKAYGDMEEKYEAFLEYPSANMLEE